MTISRKIFIGRVTLPGITPTSLATLMRTSSLHWGLESDLTTPSMDSTTGSEAGIIPDAPVYIGIDNTVSPTTGMAVAAGVNFSLQDFGPAFGVIDPNQIWFYNQSGCQMAVTFQAR